MRSCGQGASFGSDCHVVSYFRLMPEYFASGMAAAAAEYSGRLQAACMAIDEDEPAAAGASCDGVCRDFLRNVCKRGARCKYRHPPVAEAHHLARQSQLTFCHDFQNSGCHRSNCRFIHCTRDEEELFKVTGQTPASLDPTEIGQAPICKDFLKGECKRQMRCKYRHVSDVPPPPIAPIAVPLAPLTSAPLAQIAFQVGAEIASPYGMGDVMSPLAKRRRLDMEAAPFLGTAATMMASPLAAIGLRAPAPLEMSVQNVEEENLALRHRLDEMKRQLTHLVATNEVLLEQNARFRTKGSPSVICRAPPIVTVSQVVTPTITPAAALARGPPLCLPDVPGLPPHLPPNVGLLPVSLTPVSAPNIPSSTSSGFVPSHSASGFAPPHSASGFVPSHSASVFVPSHSASCFAQSPSTASLVPPPSLMPAPSTASTSPMEAIYSTSPLLAQSPTTSLISYSLLSPSQLPSQLAAAATQIQTNQITAAQIQTNHIAAAQIQTNHIAAQIQTNQMAAAAAAAAAAHIQTNHMSGSQVPTNQLSVPPPNQISVTQIQTNQITAHQAPTNHLPPSQIANQIARSQLSAHHNSGSRQPSCSIYEPQVTSNRTLMTRS